MKFIKDNFQYIALGLLILLFFGVNANTVKNKVNGTTGTTPASNPGASTTN
jgi:hypothetical protein